MQWPSNISRITSTPPADDHASYDILADVGTAFATGIATILEAHEARIAELETALVGSSSSAEVVTFAQSRSSWTVKQLAHDLGVHVNSIRNWIALPSDNPRHLDSFQPGGTGPHMILPEHVAAWISRNQNQAA